VAKRKGWVARPRVAPLRVGFCVFGGYRSVAVDATSCAPRRLDREGRAVAPPPPPGGTFAEFSGVTSAAAVVPAAATGTIGAFVAAIASRASKARSCVRELGAFFAVFSRTKGYPVLIRLARVQTAYS
jgi:hypothetical protein